MMILSFSSKENRLWECPKQFIKSRENQGSDIFSGLCWWCCPKSQDINQDKGEYSSKFISEPRWNTFIS